MLGQALLAAMPDRHCAWTLPPSLFDTHGNGVRANRHVCDVAVASNLADVDKGHRHPCFPPSSAVFAWVGKRDRRFVMFQLKHCAVAAIICHNHQAATRKRIRPSASMCKSEGRNSVGRYGHTIRSTVRASAWKFDFQRLDDAAYANIQQDVALRLRRLLGR